MFHFCLVLILNGFKIREIKKVDISIIVPKIITLTTKVYRQTETDNRLKTPLLRHSFFLVKIKRQTTSFLVY
ncbi:hypothetical protein T190115A13A_80180 [Tenacibaculum sp. 190524A02b]|uniref:Uncharacterized protein n=1 Tax=Tenacibaculum vairaonense TaxID=3137860 RepID=A0ABM9PS25_9FLAO